MSFSVKSDKMVARKKKSRIRNTAVKPSFTNDTNINIILFKKNKEKSTFVKNTTDVYIKKFKTLDASEIIITMTVRVIYNNREMGR